MNTNIDAMFKQVEDEEKLILRNDQSLFASNMSRKFKESIKKRQCESKSRRECDLRNLSKILQDAVLKEEKESIARAKRAARQLEREKEQLSKSVKVEDLIVPVEKKVITEDMIDIALLNKQLHRSKEHYERKKKLIVLKHQTKGITKEEPIVVE
jgi:hypothetical protein